MFRGIPSGNIPEKASFSWNLSKLLVDSANCLAMHCWRLVSKYLSQTNHLGLDNLAPNSTCLIKISENWLNGKHMASVFADGDFVFLEKWRQFKTIWLRHCFSPKTSAFRENQMHYFRCLLVDCLDCEGRKSHHELKLVKTERKTFLFLSFFGWQTYDLCLCRWRLRFLRKMTSV